MSHSTIKNGTQAASRSIPWLAVASGLLGFCSFVSLIAYITNPAVQMQDSGAVPVMGERLLAIQFLASAAQVLLMIPVAIWLYRTGGRQSPGLSPNRPALPWTILGVVALGAVACLRLVAMVDSAISDILFMLPMGLVGVWLIAVNLKTVALPGWMRILGGVAGIFLVGVGLNFLFNGGMVAFSKDPMAYGNDVRFHIGLGLCGFPGFILFATWSILLGLLFLRAPNR